jgi:hypothetical protein
VLLHQVFDGDLAGCGRAGIGRNLIIPEAGVGRIQRPGQALQVSPVWRGHDRHGTGGTRPGVDRLGHRPDEDEIHLVLLQPTQDEHRASVKVLEGWTDLNLSGGVDAGRTTFEQHAVPFRPGEADSF